MDEAEYRRRLREVGKAIDVLHFCQGRAPSDAISPYNAKSLNGKRESRIDKANATIRSFRADCERTGRKCPL